MAAETNRTLRNVRMAGILSFDEEGIDLALEPLNVLIGTNAAGKSNLLRGLRLLRGIAPAQDLRHRPERSPEGIVETTIDVGGNIVRHRRTFHGPGEMEVDEEVEWMNGDGADRPPEEAHNAIDERYCLARDYDETTFETTDYAPGTNRADLLDEDGANLPLVLNRLKAEQPNELLKQTRRIRDGVIDVECRTEGAECSVALIEETIGRTDARHIGAGARHYLGLIAALLQPRPGSVITIEHPEHRLHPDLLPATADLIIEASKRAQVIVTTHSTTLVDEIGNENCGAVITCEREKNSTRMARLDPKKLAPFLKLESLGGLWTSGELGANRW